MVNMKDTFQSKYEVDDNGCWIWTAYKLPGGYGQIQVNRRTTLAHRFSYEKFRGPIPKGYCVCHTCDTPSCVNPFHLFVGTQKDNVRDMLRKGRGGDNRGASNNNSKLTQDEVALIRRDDRRQVDIAQTYGISQAHVSVIKRGLSWAHV